MLLRTEDGTPLEKLTRGSGKKVWFTCEHCEIEVLQVYKNYIKQGDLKLCRTCRNKRSANLPETKAKHSANSKKNWQNPEYREKTGKSLSKARKAAWDKIPVEERVVHNTVTYEKLKLLVEQTGSILLDNEYDGISFNVKCPNGHSYETNIHKFNTRKEPCSKCRTRVHSPESIKKMSESKMGHEVTTETRAKISKTRIERGCLRGD
ncbi:MAG: hypothetical protein WC503_00950 [Candidatus Shapirobacteria bacterium]